MKQNESTPLEGLLTWEFWRDGELLFEDHCTVPIVIEGEDKIIDVVFPERK